MDAMICPVCGGEIQDGRDVLSFTWYAPRRWWVVKHMKDGKDWCGKAFFQIKFIEKIPGKTED